MFRMIQDRHC